MACPRYVQRISHIMECSKCISHCGMYKVYLTLRNVLATYKVYLTLWNVLLCIQCISHCGMSYYVQSVSHIEECPSNIQSVSHNVECPSNIQSPIMHKVYLTLWNILLCIKCISHCGTSYYV